VEEKILGFYRVAAEQSKHLMADIPRSFYPGGEEERGKDRENQGRDPEIDRRP